MIEIDRYIDRQRWRESEREGEIEGERDRERKKSDRGKGGRILLKIKLTKAIAWEQDTPAPLLVLNYPDFR